MYHKYFGLDEAPFSIAVNPRYLFMSERHRDALAHLLYGVGVGGGFILLTGEAGTGKTTITRCLLEQLPPKTDIALILNPALDAVQLLAAVCDELHIDYQPEERNLKGLTDELHRFLLANHQRGRNTVLLIDEAQHLQFEALEQIRLLTNLETNTRKLLQIILVGQPELKVMLARPELRQLSQRVTARYQLKPLTLDETAGYIRHRLQVAGLHANQELFPPKVVQHIQRESQGIPRLINVLCDRILLGTYGQNKSRVDMAMARQATQEVKGEDEQPAASAARWAWPAAAAVLALTAVGALLWWQGQQADIATLAGEVDPPPQATSTAPDREMVAEPISQSPAPGQGAENMARATVTPPAAETIAETDPALELAPVVPGPDTASRGEAPAAGDDQQWAAIADSAAPWVADAFFNEPATLGADDATAGLAEALDAEPTAGDMTRIAVADATAADAAAVSEPPVAASTAEAPLAEPDHGGVAPSDWETALEDGLFAERGAALNVLLLQEGVIDAPLENPCRRLARERWRCDELQADSWPQLLTYNSPVVMEVRASRGEKAWVVLAGLAGDKVMLAGEGDDYTLTRDQLGERWTGAFILPWQKPPGYAGPMRLDDEGPAVSWLAQKFAQLDGQPRGLAETRYNDLLQQRVALFQSEQALLVDGVAGTNTILRVRQLLGQSPVLQVAASEDAGAP
jgi:type II secretory pathway predicted ATPase ExeA